MSAWSSSTVAVVVAVVVFVAVATATTTSTATTTPDQTTRPTNKTLHILSRPRRVISKRPAPQAIRYKLLFIFV